MCPSYTYMLNAEVGDTDRAGFGLGELCDSCRGTKKMC